MFARSGAEVVAESDAESPVSPALDSGSAESEESFRSLDLDSSCGLVESEMSSPERLSPLREDESSDGELVVAEFSEEELPSGEAVPEPKSLSTPAMLSSKLLRDLPPSHGRALLVVLEFFGCTWT